MIESYVMWQTRACLGGARRIPKDGSPRHSRLCSNRVEPLYQIHAQGEDNSTCRGGEYPSLSQELIT